MRGLLSRKEKFMNKQNKEWLEAVYHKLENAPDFEIEMLRKVFLLYAKSRIEESKLQAKNPGKRFKAHYNFNIVEINDEENEA